MLAEPAPDRWQSMTCNGLTFLLDPTRSDLSEEMIMSNEAPDLFHLVERGQRQAVAAALAEGADVQMQDRFGVGLLHRAAAGGDIEMLRLLLAQGAQADAASEVGNTPLMLAAANGHLAAVELLLAEGADPKHQNRWGYSASRWAEWSSEVGDIKAVLEAAAG